ncbi:MAG: DUF262 domain-containing protein [Bacteroidales bacterium]|nr:DUF262 domain-containing protein [Bacteroidales bacterium]
MIVFKLNSGTDIFVNPVKQSEEGKTPVIYDLLDGGAKSWMRLQLSENRFEILNKDPEIADDDATIRAGLDDLVLQVIETEQSGTENTETDVPEEEDPYNPDSIKVQTKPFNLSLISEMIDKSYIDLSPDFQRNFVWNPFQKSRLIESVLLRIPLPMFYFAEDEDGNISVVDGLQRLTTIKEFMDNKFPLKGLEYLSKSCEGKYFTSENKDGSPNNLPALEPKYLKWFSMTQLTVNVIDPSSPAKVKYDIFRRINTGGKPLNNQEIRNCLASKNLRAVLKQMTNLDEFKQATDWSIKSTRMEDQEVALRFICFHRYYNEDRKLENYNGNMEHSLDTVTEKLGKMRKEDLEIYVKLFSKAMQNAHHLFGRFAFRKNTPNHLLPGAHKQLINKALFVSWSVLLSGYDPEDIKNKNEERALALPLAEIINEDRALYNYLSFGTNSKANMQAAFAAADKLISSILKF